MNTELPGYVKAMLDGNIRVKRSVREIKAQETDKYRTHNERRTERKNKSTKRDKEGRKSKPKRDE